MHGVITPFYEKAPTDGAGPIERGQIFEDQPVYFPMRHGLRIKRTDPRTDRILETELTGRTEDIFNHPPVTGITLSNSEGLIVGKAKLRRPVMVLAGTGYAPRGFDKVKEQDTFLCAPLYGAEQFSESVRQRIRAYEFPNLFYLPQEAGPTLKEGFVRFDHMQAIARDHLKRRKPAMLCDDARVALEEWLFHYLSGRLPADSLVADYRSEELSRLTSATES